MDLVELSDTFEREEPVKSAGDRAVRDSGSEAEVVEGAKPVRVSSRLWRAALDVWARYRRTARAPLTPEEEAYFKTPKGRAELHAYFSTPKGSKDLRRALDEDIRKRQPSLREAVWADAEVYSGALMVQPRFKTRLGFVAEAMRLSWTSDTFFCMLLYRVRTRLRMHKVPILPTILHRMCMTVAQIDIGNGVVLRPGVYVPHGQIVIDGMIEVGSGSVIAPWVTLGRYGPALEGPNIGNNVFIGTGAKIFGPVKIGDHARIGANAVVFKDVEPYSTVAGVPAKIVRQRDAQAGAEARPAATSNGKDAAAGGADASDED